MNTDGDAALNKNEFAKFFKSISTRKEIVDLMKRFSSNGAHMTPEDLHFFLVNEQGVSQCNCNGTPISETFTSHLKKLKFFHCFLLTSEKIPENSEKMLICNGTVDKLFSQTVNQATHSLYQSSLSFSHGQSLTQPVRWSVS